jgi:hypothetical protein
LSLLTLYHGSHEIIKQPTFGLGNAHNDYGLGFYTTEYRQLAGEWAVFSGKKDGFINEYELDTGGLNILNLDEEPVETWITVLLSHRDINYNSDNPADKERAARFVKTFPVDTARYDVIKGWRADDSFFLYIRDFITVGLSLEKLKEAMKFGNLGTQICIKTHKAFNSLVFISSSAATTELYYKLYYKSAEERDTQARIGYRKMPDKTRGTIIFDLIGRD